MRAHTSAASAICGPHIGETHDDTLAIKAREAGVSLLLGKPYDDAALVAHIEASLGHTTETVLNAS